MRQGAHEEASERKHAVLLQDPWFYGVSDYELTYLLLMFNVAKRYLMTE